MRTLTAIIIAILMASTATAQTKQEFDIKNFNSIHLSAGAKVTITQGKKYKVRAEYNLPEGQELIVGKNEKTLVIRTKNGNKPTREHHYLNFYITMPDLKSIESKGAIDLTLNKMKIGDLNIKSSGAADMEIEDLSCDNLFINQNGAADIEGTIRCKGNAAINTNGAGDYSLDISANGFSLNTNGASEAEVIFTGKSCTISSNGASEIELTTECESLSCESHGASTISVKGTADITKIKSHGASKINTSMLNQF